MAGHAPTLTTSPDLAEVLSSWEDSQLQQLLEHRPDLAHPAPSSITAMASRATARASVARAMAQLDAPALVTLEAVVILAESRPPTPERLTAALGARAGRSLQDLLDLALVMHTSGELWPVPVAADCLGPHPLGLGPRLADLGVPPAEGWPTTGQAVRSVRAQAPEAARRMLDALTWGPPVGTVTRDIPPGARWLLDNHVLARTSATELTLPREVALAARGARLAPRVSPAPPVADAPTRPARTVAAEAARAAESLLDRISSLLRSWAHDPTSVLRSGGVGVREVRQLATQWDVPTAQAALVIELAGAAGLLGHVLDAEGSWWTAADDAEGWDSADLADRWANLAATWINWPRTPWLAGTRTDKQVLRAALEPGLQRSWAPGLRRRVLLALTQWPAGAAPTAAQVRDHLAWHTAKAVPPEAAVAAVLAEAAALGLTGAGALAPTGRVLLEVSQEPIGPDRGGAAVSAPGLGDAGNSAGVARASAGDAGAGGDAGASAADAGAIGEALAGPQRCCRTTSITVSATGVARLADELATMLPPTVAEMIIQGDLTAVVPGRPTAALQRLVETVAEVESREPATTVRFTAASVRRALDAGMGPEEVLAKLRDASATPLPQPLEYLIRDVARSHGAVRIGAAGSYLRSEDPAALTRLLTREDLAHLGLRALAPTVLVARADARTVAAATAETGASPVVEGPDGEPVQLPATARAAVPPIRPGEQIEKPAEPTLNVVAQMRSGEQRAREVLRAREQQPAAPADALEALRLAARRGAVVDLEMAGARGEVQSRRVRPLRVDPGRIRVLDVRRDAEITVAPHRIAAVRQVH